MLEKIIIFFKRRYEKIVSLSKDISKYCHLTCIYHLYLSRTHTPTLRPVGFCLRKSEVQCNEATAYKGICQEVYTFNNWPDRLLRPICKIYVSVIRCYLLN